MRLDGDKPGEVYEAWFPRNGYRWDCFVEIYKGTAASKTNDCVDWVDWDWTNAIILKLV